MSYLTSVLDKSPVADGSTPEQALRNSLQLAQRAEQLGYHRYWFAEHHAAPTLASPAPEVLAAWRGEAVSAHVLLCIQGVVAGQRAFQQQAVPAEEALSGQLAVLELAVQQEQDGFVGCVYSHGIVLVGAGNHCRFDIDAREARPDASAGTRQSTVGSGHADAGWQ